MTCEILVYTIITTSRYKIQFDIKRFNSISIDLPDIHHLHNEPGLHEVKSDDADFLEEWKEPLFWMVLPFFLH